MLRQRIEQLKHEYTDQYVVVDADRPGLARFKGITGQVKTINMGGRALVQFDANSDAGWYDIALDYLKVVDKPEPKPAAPAGKAAAGKAAVAKKPPPEKPPSAPEPVKQPKPSPLELARMEKQAQQAAEAGPEQAAPGAEPGATEISDAAEPSGEPGGQTPPARPEPDRDP